MPFGVIAVQQFGWGPPLHSRGQLPAEISRLLQPGLQSQTTVGPVYVRGVSSQQNPANPILVNQAAAVRCPRKPNWCAHLKLDSNHSAYGLSELVGGEFVMIRRRSLPFHGCHPIDFVSKRDNGEVSGLGAGNSKFLTSEFGDVLLQQV